VKPLALDSDGKMNVQGYRKILTIFSIGVLLTLSFTLTFWVYYYCGYGFDFTDESFYLQWISHPAIYTMSVTQFGFIYHPLFELFQGNIVLLRRINVTILLLLSILCAYFIFNNKFLKSNKLLSASLSFVLATGIFAYFQLWIATPSYNSLNMQALLLASIGVLLVYRENYIHFFLPSTIISIAMWLSFMAKTPSCAYLILSSFIFLIFLSHHKLKIFISTFFIFLGLFSFSGIMIDGTVCAFVKRITSSLYMTSLLGTQNGVSGIFRIDTIDLSGLEWGYFGLFLITFLLAIVGYIKNFLSKKYFVLIIFFLNLPFVYSFGTNNNFWITATHAGYFWLLGSLILLLNLNIRYRSNFILLFILFTFHVLTTLVLNKTWASPYRQDEPFSQSSSMVLIGGSSSKVVLSKEYKNYIESLKNLTSSYNLVNMPMIDLTGHFPGADFILGAYSPGVPWLMGAYPGSHQFAQAAIKTLKCEELSRAWIITEPGGAFKIPTNVISDRGLDLLKDYQLVGEVQSPRGQTLQIHKQYLYRPKDIKKSIESCEAV
jgi:hypothetical protein